MIFDYFHIKLFLSIYLKKYFKSIFLFLIAIFLIWNFFCVKSFFYKRIYGTPASEQFEVWMEPLITNLDGTSQEQKLTINGHKIIGIFRRKFSLSGVLGYRDINVSFSKRYFWNSGNEIGKMYNQIASADLAILHGKTAQKDNLKKIEISHELNAALFTKCLQCTYYDDEFNNFHVLPASKNIKRALEILPKNKFVPIYIEGYLLDWKGVDNYASLEMKTALSPGEISHQKLGGQVSGLCFQIYLTELHFDGYVFK